MALINDIEQEVRNKKESKADSYQSTTMEKLIDISNKLAFNEKNSYQLQKDVARSTAKLEKSIVQLSKSFSVLNKGTTTAGRYSAGFDKSLHQFQPKDISKYVPKPTDMTETNRLLTEILNKKPEKQKTEKESNNMNGLIPLIASLIPALLPLAGIATAIALLNSAVDNLPAAINTVLKTADLAKKTASAVVKTALAPIKLMTSAAKAIFSKKETVEAGAKAATAKVTADAVEAGATAAAKAAGKETVKAGATATAKTTGKVAAAKTLGKIIPGASMVLEGMSAKNSFEKGNIVGGSLHSLAATADAVALGTGVSGVATVAAPFAKGISLAAGLAGTASDFTYKKDINKGISGGKSTDGLDSKFKSKLETLIGNTGEKVIITSSLRNTEQQQKYYDEIGNMPGTITRPNGTRVNGKWQVAMPGSSKHEYGLAVDIDKSTIRDQAKFIDNAQKLNMKIIEESNDRGSWYHLQAMAKGGITKGPTPALIGEAGREAVIPLESDEGIGALAESMGKYNMKDPSSRILSQILGVLIKTNNIPLLNEIKESLKNSGDTMVSISNPQSAGVTG